MDPRPAPRCDENDRPSWVGPPGPRGEPLLAARSLSPRMAEDPTARGRVTARYSLASTSGTNLQYAATRERNSPPAFVRTTNS